MITRFCFLSVLLAATLAAPARAETKLTTKGVQFFESKIRPVLVARCYQCHSANSKEVKGGLLLDSREGIAKGGESGPAVVPGNLEESLLLQAIKHETYEMPPGDKLSDNVIADFEKWVEMGAPDPRSKSDANKKPTLAEARKFWAFQPVKKQKPPQIDSSWPRSDIDRFVLEKMNERQLAPVADADRYTLLRRLSFDLTGLPPTPAEIEQFLADPSPHAVETVVDRLLASTQFGERWGRHWLDAARYGESAGKERNIPYPYAWRYRDYVIDSFNNDKPYNRFLTEQIAGDLLPAASNADHNTHLIATGFLAIGTKGLNERKKAQYLADVADDQIDVVSRAVLGVTVACARCHDHKFDPFTQSDYYALAGIFRSTEVLDGVEPGNNKRGYQGEYAYLLADHQPATVKPSAEEEKKIEELKKERGEVQQRLLVGQARLKAKAVKEPEAVKKLIERGKRRIEAIDDEIAAVLHKPATSNQPVMAIRDVKNPHDFAINLRGEVDKLGPVVPRGIPVVLALGRPPKFDTQQSGRLQLAGWITSKENPLTARVMVNRIWSHLIGRGLVESLDNFGALGDEPTHPELLDYLAHRFVERNWSVKKLIREIVLSRTYQLSSEHHAGNYAIDADNRYLWRMSRRRLEAEAIRDSLLAASGKLDVKRPEGSPVMKMAGGEMVRGRMARSPTESNHRSVYLPLIRSAVPESLSVFDAADPSLSIGQREVTTVATQALFIMNSPLVIQNSQALARRLFSDGSMDDRHRLDLLFLVTLSRLPDDAERTKSENYLRDYQSLLAGKVASPDERRSAAWSSLAQSLFATGEFRYVY
jgi:mono/diheme cytochrome c family protein